MEIVKGIEMKGKALWLKKSKTLVIADIHLGYEHQLISQGTFVPKTSFFEIEKEIKELMLLKPKTVVINGDLKHEFGTVSKQEWIECLDLIDLFEKTAKVVLVKGNHDVILKPIAERRKLKIVSYYCAENVCILHGHKIYLDKEIYDKKIKTIIIGHEHPAVSIREGVKQEMYKCFLKGRWHGKNLVVMPSFFYIFEGSDVKREKLLSPFLNEKDIKNFNVFILGDKIYNFGKLRNI